MVYKIYNTMCKESEVKKYYMMVQPNGSITTLPAEDLVLGSTSTTCVAIHICNVGYFQIQNLSLSGVSPGREKVGKGVRGLLGLKLLFCFWTIAT